MLHWLGLDMLEQFFFFACFLASVVYTYVYAILRTKAVIELVVMNE